MFKPFVGTKEQAFDLAVENIERNGYIMTPEIHLGSLLKELEKDGLLLRCDKAGDKNPVKGFNDEYSYIYAIGEV